MIRWLTIVMALVLAGCEPMQLPEFPEAGGPASLRLVPADYFSKRLRHRPGPRPGPDSGPAKPRPAESGDDGTVRIVAPEPTVPPEISSRLEKIDAQLQWLRRSITRPPRPKTEPPT